MDDGVIELLDENGHLICEFDGNVWRFFEHADNIDISSELLHSEIEDTPFWLYLELEAFGDPTGLLKKLATKSPELSRLIDGFFREKQRLLYRLVLFEKAGSGVVDQFVDRISISEEPGHGYVVEATIEDDKSYREYTRNAFGEIVTVTVANLFDAEDILEAIEEITSEDHWDDKGWTWKETLSNLSIRYPQFAAEIDQNLNDRGKLNSRRIKDEPYFVRRIASFCSAERFDFALECAHEAIERFPFSAILRAARGEVYFSKADIEHAKKDYETALQFDMEDASLLNNLGICYVVSREFELALASLTKAIELKPKPETYLLRAKVYRSLARIELAISDEQEADKLKKVESHGHFSRAASAPLTKSFCELHQVEITESVREYYAALINPTPPSWTPEEFRSASAKHFPNSEANVLGSRRLEIREEFSDQEAYYETYRGCMECTAAEALWKNLRRFESDLKTRGRIGAGTIGERSILRKFGNASCCSTCSNYFPSQFRECPYCSRSKNQSTT
jgi:tetratricopeptide (TPR) repeat protein